MVKKILGILLAGILGALALAYTFVCMLASNFAANAFYDKVTGRYAHEQRVENGINKTSKDLEELKKSQESWTLRDIVGIILLVVIVAERAYVAYNYIMSLKQDKNLAPYKASLYALEQRSIVYSK